jgi:Response regulators consisting of a CheY-like receiver domain and a winged-helix DNA-binding domain
MNHAAKGHDVKEHTAHLPKILVADDDLEILRLVEAALRPIGATVITASNGEEALERVLTEKPKLVILDVMMPGLTGWEVAKYIRGHPECQHVRILMVTGIGEDMNQATSPVMGADDFVSKPFTLEDLANRVRKLLATS